MILLSGAYRFMDRDTQTRAVWTYLVEVWSTAVGAAGTGVKLGLLRKGAGEVALEQQQEEATKPRAIAALEARSLWIINAWS